MRKENQEIKEYLNKIISKNSKDWKYKKGANFGIRFQELVGEYYQTKRKQLSISKVEINENPNDDKPDVEIFFKDGKYLGIEVKSCKDGSLSGVTICNAPELLNDKDAFLINYIVQENKVVKVLNVYETKIFRLTSICKKGKYKGCLIATRDTGKKIKGRSFSDFINSDEKDDYTLSQLTNPSLIRKTILYYTVSKLVDKKYKFSDKEILEAIHDLGKRSKK